MTFTTPPHLQMAVAYGLRKDDSYYDGLSQDLAAKRDRMAAGLAALGFSVLPCNATYFLTCGFEGLGLGRTDVEACETLVTDAGVAAVPVSAFYGSDAPRLHSLLLLQAGCRDRRSARPSFRILTAARPNPLSLIV